MFTPQSHWIGAGQDRVCPLVRRTFPKPDGTVTIRISGLGFFELSINGQSVSKDLFVPAFSDYRKRQFQDMLYPFTDELQHRVYVLEYDITGYLQAGENTLTVLLGDGWYRQLDRTVEGQMHFGQDLCVRYELYQNGTLFLCSDGSEVYTDSFIRKTGLFCTEVQDFSPRQSVWKPVWRIEDFCQRYELQKCPADRVCSVISPKLLYSEGTRHIYDAGKCLSGRVRILSGGGDITVRYADEMAGQELDFNSSGGESQIQQDVFLHTAPGDEVFPRFRWSGFRYLEITGNTQQVTVEEIHCDVAVTAEFSCSDDTINFFYRGFLNSYLSNLHAGVPSDCPHRERLGYTGDGQLTCESGLLTTDSQALYRKWLEDIYDCQDTVTGHVQHTAPFSGGGGGPGGWGGAIAIVPEALYRITGDKALARCALPHIHRYLQCMENFCQDGLVVRERDGGWCLGDWCVPNFQVQLPESYVNTYFYIRCMEIADFLAMETGESTRYSSQIADYKSQLIRHFYDPVADSFCGSVQGADLFAIDLGIAPSSLIQKTAGRYRNEPVPDTGIFGTELLLKFLSTQASMDTLIRLLSRREHPSFGYMQEHNATALWETWEGFASHNHPMFGAGVKYLFYGLLGIKPQWHTHEILIEPPDQALLSYISGKLSLWGNTVSVHYDYTQQGLQVSVTASDSAILVYHGQRYRLASGQNSFTFPN